MTIGDGTETHLERPRMDGATEPERRRLDIERVGGSEPVEEPQALLGERQRELVRPVGAAMAPLDAPDVRAS